MKKKMRRLFSGVLAAVMAVGMLPAYAELDVGADVDVVDNKGTSQAAVIDSAPAQFNVIVPTKLPFAILANNETLKATNAAIKNQGNGPVKLAGITAEGKGWAFADYDSVDFDKMPMNSKVFTMELNGDKVPEAAVDTKVNVPITQSAWASGAEGSIYGKTDLPISYDGKFAPQADASEEAVVAHVVFTIGWQTADDTNNGGDNQNNENDPVTNPDEKLAKPSFTTDATTFIYDGQPHFPDISTDGVVLDGETAPKTDVGTYTTTITPADGYVWDDGTKTPVTVEWKIMKADSVVSKAPTARTLTYNGEAQELVNAGSTTDGTMQYKLDNGAWGTAIPTATDAGNYTVSYKVVGDDSHNDVAEKSVVVTIARKRIAMPTVMTFSADGEAHFPEYNYPAGSVDMSGATDAQSAVGKYTTTVTPTKNYAWTDGTTDAKTITWEIVKAVSEFEGQEIFGVRWEWDESNSSTALTRLTTANDPYHLVNTNITTEPVAAIEGSRAGSSPFDNYMPYAGMEQYNIVNNKVVAKRGDAGFSNTFGDTMVYIPEFYYKVAQDGADIYFYLSNHEVDGFEKHPGSGNYVGRYTTASGYVSKSGKTPLVNITRAKARTGSMAKGDNWSQYDFATWQAIQYLYLIEYADWDSQAKIGRGYVDSNPKSAHVSGATDTMSYHTGRPAGTDSKTAVQYRWIENPWGNVCQFVDGINFNNRVAYISSNYKTYADNTTDGYIATGVTLPTSGYIKSFGSSTTAPWALIPSAIGGSKSTYVPDYISLSSGWPVPYVGGYWYSVLDAGLFCFYADYGSSVSDSNIGARLLYHP